MSITLPWPFCTKGTWNLLDGIAQLRLGIVHHGLEVAVLLQGVTDAFRVLFQFGGVKRFGKNAFQENRLGNADWVQVLHGSLQRAAAHVLIALESGSCRP